MPRGERPLDAVHNGLCRFAADLRMVRKQAGSPTYRELSKRANYSVTALAQAANGRRLPTLTITLAYVRACGGDVDQWRCRWQELAAELAAEIAPPAPMAEAPYLGLAAFQRDDGDRFFGREKVVAELRELVAKRRFTGVFGASGAGKSSVLRAGLLAAADGPSVLFTPGVRPMEECAVALAAITGATVPDLCTDFARDHHNLHLRIRQALADRPDTELLIVVDQFEELFTLCADPAEREWFVHALVHASTADTSRTRVVIGVRGDFLDHCGEHPELVEALRGGHLQVGAMSPEEMRQVITRPAADHECMVEAPLVSRIIADATGQPVALPLVSHALLETWRRRSGARLTLAGYEAAGGIQHAVAHTAEQVHTGFTPAQQDISRRLFLRLVALGDNAEDTKRRVHRRELDVEAEAVLEELAKARLITLDHDRVELTHEALIRCWPRLRGWLADGREGLRVHRRLTDAVEVWETHNHDADALYRGVRLAVARDWAATHDNALSTREQRFLDASIAAEETEQASARRRTRRLRQLVALLSVLLLVTTAVTGLALQAQRTATEQRNVALVRQVLTDVAGLRSTNPALATQLSLAAHRLVPLPETRDALLSAFGTPFASKLAGHTSNEILIAWASNGRLLATVGWDQTARLWEVTDPERPREITTLRLGEPLSAVAFAPGWKTMVTMGENGTRLWDITDPQRPRELATLPTKTKSWGSIAFSGHLMATATDEKSAQLWDVSDPQRPRELATFAGSTNRINAVAFHPRDKVLATAGDTGAQLWNVTDPRTPQPLGGLPGHTSTVSSIAFSPDGHSVATASWDHTLRLWDTRDPNALRHRATLTGHDNHVQAVAFSPDSRTLVSSEADGGTILWDLGDPDHPHTLTKLPGGRYSVVFSPDGTTFATVDDDRTVRLQQLHALPLVGHRGLMPGVAFHPDGGVLATGSWDGTARLWDVRDPAVRRPLATIQAGAAAVRWVLFSPDRRTLVTANDDGVARVWDISDPHVPDQVGSITPNTREIVAFAFSPDGRRLGVGGFRAFTLWDMSDRTAPRELARREDPDTVWTVLFGSGGNTLVTGGTNGRLTRFWDVRTNDPGELRFPFSDTEIIRARSLSPDGRTLATFSNKHKTVQLFDVTDPPNARPLALLPDLHGGIVWTVAFSPDGRRLATAGSDRVIRLWDVTQPSRPQHIGTLTGHTSDVAAMTFSPDGRTLASTGADNTARLWETDLDRIRTRICSLAYPDITEAEWDRYFPGVSYQPPCP